jgi:hypothetical protein
MIEQFIEELNELKQYKDMYIYAEKDKEKMSNLLYKYMVEEYVKQPYKERCEAYRKEVCCNCRHRNGCVYMSHLPEDILKPIKSNTAWIPGKKCCEHFSYS